MALRHFQIEDELAEEITQIVEQRRVIVVAVQRGIEEELRSCSVRRCGAEAEFR